MLRLLLTFATAIAVPAGATAAEKNDMFTERTETEQPAARPLKWQVETQTGEITVCRTDGGPEWQGSRLAEITYWDAKGVEQHQAVMPQSGWTIQQQPIDDGCQLICRQDTPQFSFLVRVSVLGDVLTVDVSAADITETGPVRLKTLRLLPRFGAAEEGNSYRAAIGGPMLLSRAATGRTSRKGLSEHLPMSDALVRCDSRHRRPGRNRDQWSVRR